MSDYKKRIAELNLADQLEAMGAVLIEGPKYCGKTTMAFQQAGSVLLMSDPDNKEQNLALARTNIRKLLEGETPRLIDEWQLVPQFWDAVRNEVDRRNADGQFILTGSAVPPRSTNEEEKIFHTGTGRISRLKLRTMSLYESGESTGEVSLLSLFEDASNVEGTNHIDLDQLAFLVCRGGWPKATLKENPKAALMQAKQYYKTVAGLDISRADGVERNEELAKRLMRSYARNQGSQATL